MHLALNGVYLSQNQISGYNKSIPVIHDRAEFLADASLQDKDRSRDNHISQSGDIMGTVRDIRVFFWLRRSRSDAMLYLEDLGGCCCR